MARGWESKAIEEQQAEAREKQSTPKYRLSPGQAALMRELEGLRLSRARILQQMGAARDPRHLSLLQEALAELDRKVLELQNQSPGSTKGSPHS